MFNPLSPGGTYMYHLENFHISRFLRILGKYFQYMLEASRDPYKTTQMTECMDNIKK